MSETREDRFRALYDLTRPKIISYSLRRTSSPEDAADVVAETYEIAWRRLDDVPSGQPGLLWLYVTARYVLANHGRRLRRRDATTARIADELRGVPLHVESSDTEGLVLRSGFDSLSAEEREILMLAGWEGLSAGQIGEVLGCTPTAARIRLHRARARLKAAMADVSLFQKHPSTEGHERDEGAVNGGAFEEVREP
jgi:RNA polymerase sigma-70 factor (ECF subfamily)